MNKISEMLTKNHTPISFNFVEDLAAKRLYLDGPYIELGSDHLTDLEILPENAAFNPLTTEVFSTDLSSDEAKELGLNLSKLEDIRLLKSLKYSIEIPHEYVGHIRLTRAQNHYYNGPIINTFVPLLTMQNTPLDLLHNFLYTTRTIHYSTIVQEYYALRKQKRFCTKVKFSSKITLWDICRDTIKIQSRRKYPHVVALRMLEKDIQNNWKIDLVDFAFHVGFICNPLRSSTNPSLAEFLNASGNDIQMAYPDDVLLCSQMINEDELKECHRKEDQIQLLLEKMERVLPRITNTEFLDSVMREKFSYYPNGFPDLGYLWLNLYLKHGLITKDQYNIVSIMACDSLLQRLLLNSYIVSRIEGERWLRALYFEKKTIKTTTQACGERMLKLAIELIKLRDRIFTPLMYLSSIKSPQGTNEYLQGTAKVYIPPQAVKHLEVEVFKNREWLNRIIRDFNK